MGSSIRCVGALLAVALWPGRGIAAELHVAVDGDDAGDGSNADPVQTIARGLALVGPGDVLSIHAGTYAETIHDSIPGGDDWDAPVTVRASPGDDVVVRAPAGSGWVLHFEGAHQHHIIVEGLVLDGSAVEYEAVKITGTGPDAATAIRLSGCEILGSPRSGVLVSGDATANELLALDIHDNGTADFDHGVYVASSGNVVEGCAIHDNAGWGVHVYGPTTRPSANVVHGNLIVDNAAAGDRGPGIGLYSGTDNRAYNNVIVGNAIGIAIGYDAERTSIAHNTVVESLGHAVYIETTASMTEVHNLLAYGNGTDAVLDLGSQTTHGAELLGVDPAFVDPPGGDYRLRADSVAVGLGTPIAWVQTDFDGVPRTDDGDAAVDLGAFEHVDAAGSTGDDGGSDGGDATGSDGLGGSETFDLAAATSGDAPYDGPGAGSWGEVVPRASGDRGCGCASDRGAARCSWLAWLAVLLGQRRSRRTRSSCTG